jgi:hypothetical protein
MVFIILTFRFVANEPVVIRAGPNKIARWDDLFIPADRRTGATLSKVWGGGRE